MRTFPPLLYNTFKYTPSLILLYFLFSNSCFGYHLIYVCIYHEYSRTLTFFFFRKKIPRNCTLWVRIVESSASFCIRQYVSDTREAIFIFLLAYSIRGCFLDSWLEQFPYLFASRYSHLSFSCGPRDWRKKTFNDFR